MEEPTLAELAMAIVLARVCVVVVKAGEANTYCSCEASSELGDCMVL